MAAIGLVGGVPRPTAGAKALAPAAAPPLYLPILARAPNDTIFGVQLDPITDANGFSRVVSAKSSWTRRNGVLWSEVEPTQGARNWAALTGLEAELVRAAQAGLRVILIVRSTPDWAQETSGSACGPIRPDKLGAFGAFMHDLVARYSAAPYFVKYWEIWNEPDVAVQTGAGGENEYGCWGDPNDMHFGGYKYADMLKIVTPQIRSADPGAQVIVGGLLLDCDPGNPPAGKDCKSSLYLEGILEAGGGQYLDGVSFHAYDFYQGGVGNYSNANWNSSSSTTGPVGIAKYNYLRQLLVQRGYPDKYLMNTETALLCFGCTPADINDDFEGTKSFYVAQSYAVGQAQGLRANVWYNSRGWYNSGLLDQSANPRFAYVAYKVSRDQLQKGAYLRTITEYPDVLGYEFARTDARVWVIWSLATGSRNIDLPATPAAVVDTFGGAVAVTGTTLTVGSMPLYVIWQP